MTAVYISRDDHRMEVERLEQELARAQEAAEGFRRDNARMAAELAAARRERDEMARECVMLRDSISHLEQAQEFVVGQCRKDLQDARQEQNEARRLASYADYVTGYWHAHAKAAESTAAELMWQAIGYRAAFEQEYDRRCDALEEREEMRQKLAIEIDVARSCRDQAELAWQRGNDARAALEQCKADHDRIARIVEQDGIDMRNAIDDHNKLLVKLNGAYETIDTYAGKLKAAETDLEQCRREKAEAETRIADLEASQCTDWQIQCLQAELKLAAEQQGHEGTKEAYRHNHTRMESDLARAQERIRELEAACAAKDAALMDLIFLPPGRSKSEDGLEGRIKAALDNTAGFVLLERIRKLEAVAKVARTIRRCDDGGHRDVRCWMCWHHGNALIDALAALDDGGGGEGKATMGQIWCSRCCAFTRFVDWACTACASTAGEKGGGK